MWIVDKASEKFFCLCLSTNTMENIMPLLKLSLNFSANYHNRLLTNSKGQILPTSNNQGSPRNKIIKRAKRKGEREKAILAIHEQAEMTENRCQSYKASWWHVAVTELQGKLVTRSCDRCQDYFCLYFKAVVYDKTYNHLGGGRVMSIIHHCRKLYIWQLV